MRPRVPLTLAAAALLGLSGCRLLAKHPAPTAFVGDAGLNAHVLIALVADPQVDAREIIVHTSQGTVVLEGVVDSAAMARSAVAAARAVPGVASVDDRLEVADAHHPSPAHNSSAAHNPNSARAPSSGAAP
ncbi:MAG: BON domain-containing protein [Steroidobacteraceae bacterium]